MNSIEFYSLFNKESQLSREEERELIIKSEQGSKAARDRLVLSNLKFAGYAAKHNKFSRMDSQDDLIGECIYGLVKAANNVNSKKDNKFITYANFYIKSAVDDANNKCGCAVRLPELQYRLLKKIMATNGKNLKLYKDEIISRKVTANEIGVSEKEVELKLKQSQNALNLEDTFSNSEQEGRNYEDVMADSSNKNFEDEIIMKDSCDAIRKIVNRLPKKEACVLKLRFGLNGEEPMSFSEIGRRMGFTRAWANDIEKKAKKHLLQYADELEQYIA